MGIKVERRLMMKLRIFVIVVVCLFSGFLSTAQAQTKPCGCEDKADLLELLNQVEMSIQEAQFQMDSILAKERESGKPTTATDEGVGPVYEAIHNAAKSVANATYPGDSMNLIDCTIKRGSSHSDCVELVKKHFYDIPQKACLASKSSRDPDEPYYKRMELRSFLVQLMMAYTEERKFILDMLKSLPNNCRPNDWFGYIVLTRVFTSEEVEPIPPTPRLSHLTGATFGGTRTTKKEGTEIGLVLVRNGKPMSIRASGASTENAAFAGSREVYCGGAVGWKTGQDELTYKSFLKSKDNDDAYDASDRTVLTVNPANQTYNVYTTVFPRVNLTGEKARSEKSAFTLCRGQDAPDSTEPYTSSIIVHPHSVTNEKIKPGSPDFLEGSRTVKPPEFNKPPYKQGNVTTTLTLEIQFRWMLRRLPAK